MYDWIDREKQVKSPRLKSRGCWSVRVCRITGNFVLVQRGSDQISTVSSDTTPHFATKDSLSYSINSGLPKPNKLFPQDECVLTAGVD